jgi:hypothetical protein
MLVCASRNQDVAGCVKPYDIFQAIELHLLLWMAAKRVPGQKGGLSDSMRAKLMRENQALGGDPDSA